MDYLAECTFKEFVNSPFFDEFCTSDREGGDALISDKEKIALCTDDCGYGHYLHSFYKKGPSGRWVKKGEFSDEQISDDGYVQLKGGYNGAPKSIDIFIGSFEFEFVLTYDMVNAFRTAYQYGDDGYFPDYEVSYGEDY